jgi:hypothetical protein
MPAEYALGTAWHDRLIPEKIMKSCIVESIFNNKKYSEIRPTAVAMIVLTVSSHAEYTK